MHVDIYGSDPKKVLCALADEYNVLMMIVGKRGLGALKRLVMGSVSEYVVHHAKCAVLWL